MRILPSDLSPTKWMLKKVNTMIQPESHPALRHVASRAILAVGSVPMGLASSAYNAAAIIKSPVTLFKYTVGQFRFKGEKIGDKLAGGFEWKEIAMHVYKAVAFFIMSFVGVLVGICSPKANEKLHKMLGLINSENHISGTNIPLPPPPPPQPTQVRIVDRDYTRDTRKENKQQPPLDEELKIGIAARRENLGGKNNKLVPLPVLKETVHFVKKIEVPKGFWTELQKVAEETEKRLAENPLKDPRDLRVIEFTPEEDTPEEHMPSFIQHVETKVGQFQKPNKDLSSSDAIEDWEAGNVEDDPYGDRYIQVDALKVGPYQHKKSKNKRVPVETQVLQPASNALQVPGITPKKNGKHVHWKDEMDATNTTELKNHNIPQIVVN